MVALGGLIALIGLALMIPRDSMPGSTSHRVVTFDMSGPFVTPNDRGQPSTWRGKLIRVAIGLGLIAIGVVLIGLEIGF